MDRLYTQFDSAFFEKTRLSIMTLLYREKELSFNALKNALSMSDGALYSHLEKLISAEYIAKEKTVTFGNVKTIYTIQEQGTEVFEQYINFIESILKGEVNEK